MHSGIATRKFDHVGAMPSLTLSTSVSGDRIRKIPTSTSSSWVMKSMIASATFTPADSWTPRTLMTLRTTITPMPKKMSPGEWRSAGQNRPPR